MPTHLLPVEHRPQETEAGCLPACAQMVLAHLGMPATQNELARLLDLRQAGVPFSRLRRLEQLGVRVLLQAGTDTDLREAIDRNLAPIVFVHTGHLSYWQVHTQHAVVVVGYDDRDFWVNDPGISTAPQRVSGDELLLAWSEFDYFYAVASRL